MTAPRTLQRRRVASPDGVPPAVSRWFAGGPLCWEALLEAEKVPAWWRDWRREHPGSDHPPGATWIDWNSKPAKPIGPKVAASRFSHEPTKE